MRFNDKELRLYIRNTPVQLEGQLSCYLDSKEGWKDRKVCLLNSLLLLYKVSRNGVFSDLEPSEVIVLTDCTVRVTNSRPNSFDIVCPGSPFNSTFSILCKLSSEHDQWMAAIKRSSASSFHSQLHDLQRQITETKDRLQQRRQQIEPPVLYNPFSPPRTQKPSDDLLLIDFS